MRQASLAPETIDGMTHTTPTGVPLPHHPAAPAGDRTPTLTLALIAVGRAL